MSNPVFGWGLPPGAANHPLAPWNQDVPETCPVCGKDNADDHGDPIDANHFPYCSQECELEDEENW